MILCHDTMLCYLVCCHVAPSCAASRRAVPSRVALCCRRMPDPPPARRSSPPRARPSRPAPPPSSASPGPPSCCWAGTSRTRTDRACPSHVVRVRALRVPGCHCGSLYPNVKWAGGREGVRRDGCHGAHGRASRGVAGRRADRVRRLRGRRERGARTSPLNIYWVTYRDFGVPRFFTG